MSAPVPLNSGCCSTPCPTSPQTAVPGPQGENAFSFTVGNFTQPAVGGSVTVALTHDGWVAQGQTVFVQTGGYYSVASVTGLNVSLTNLGLTGNASPGFVVSGGAKVTPGGVGGNVGNAWTTTTANFTQPAVSSQVSVPVLASGWAAVGQVVFVATGGYYSVFSIPDSTHLSLTNLGYTGNAAPAAVINFPQQVSPAGLIGATGSSGLGTLNSISPTTTKGDLIADNGANNPAASDVRVAAGTNGQLLASDSTQAAGLGWKSVVPVSVATSGDIAIFNGSSGTPTPLQDSKMLITTDGALQSTPSGGNARGTKAVDLQVQRSVATQVASGNTSSISGGQNNTASATDSRVGGGTTNAATGAQSTVAGGNTNTASNTSATVGGGINNTASGTSSVVAGGSGNTASSIFSGVLGGATNSAGGANGVIGGGSSNATSGAFSAILGGTQAIAELYGKHAHASGAFANNGDAQTSELLWRVTTTDATAGVEAFLDGSGASQRAVLSPSYTWAFDILVCARSSAGVGAAWRVVGAVQNNAGTVTLVAAVTTTVLADGTGGTWGVAGNLVVSADNVNKSLKIAVTGAAATTIRWVARGRLVEINF